MSGIKPAPLTEFYRSLKERGVRTEDLAATLGVSGGAVRRILGGHRRKGPLWRRLAPLLSERERQLMADVEQCSAWNMKRLSKRPHWTPEKSALLAQPHPTSHVY
jgi:hypothetical protein